MESGGSNERFRNGQFHNLVIYGFSRDTGRGMEYSNGLRLEDKSKKVLYDSGLLVWRPGGYSPIDRDDLQLRTAVILEETEGKCVFGYTNGVNTICIKEVSGGKVQSILSFSLRERDKLIQKNKFPTDMESFERWSETFSQSRVNCSKVEFEDDELALKILKHCDQSANYIHDEFRCIIWYKKAEKVAISYWIRTNFQNPQRFNYAKEWHCKKVEKKGLAEIVLVTDEPCEQNYSKNYNRCNDNPRQFMLKVSDI